MADDVCEGIENALNITVSTTERSGNMKEEYNSEHNGTKWEHEERIQ